MAMKEMSQPAWWLNYYKVCCAELCLRVRQHLEEGMDVALLMTLVEGVETTLNEMKTEE
ncbi:MAG: hypothetical protein L7U25_06680 [Candidatus Poseidonia sp.]|nr:hypothetical protein [Poseidonia sp.]